MTDEPYPPPPSPPPPPLPGPTTTPTGPSRRAPLAMIIGVVVLAQLPSARELAGVALVIVGVALHRYGKELDAPHPERAQGELVEAGGYP